MVGIVKYDSMKVGELRALCKARGIDSDQKKEDLIAALKAADSTLSQDQPNNQPIVTEQQTLINRGHSPEELREIATIADEIRHLRKQWLSQAMKSGSTTVSQGRK